MSNSEIIEALQAQVDVLQSEKDKMEARFTAEYQTLLSQFEDSVDKFEKISTSVESILASKGISVKNSTEDITELFDRYNEQLQTTVAAAQAEIERVQAENEGLQAELGKATAEIDELKSTITEIRQQKSVQTFGSLSGMLSSPAFKAATLGIFTQFAGDNKRKEGFGNATNANIRNTIPEEAPDGLVPIKKYYINLLAQLSEQLQADQSPIQINNPEHINILANILKIVSSPQPAGIYSLNDDVFNSAVAQSLIKQLNAVNELSYNSSEPVLFIPTPEAREILKQGKIKLPGNIELNQQVKTQLIQNFFSVNNTVSYIMYPAIKIGDFSKEEKSLGLYIENIDINLFEIKNNTVRFGRYLVDKKPGVQANVVQPGKSLPTLGSFVYQDAQDKKFFAPGVGNFVSRAEIIRIFIKSLLSALRTAWAL